MTACLLVSPVLAAPPMWRVASQPSLSAPWDCHPDGPRPASRGARVREFTIICFMTAQVPSRTRARPRPLQAAGRPAAGQARRDWQGPGRTGPRPENPDGDEQETEERSV